MLFKDWRFAGKVLAKVYRQALVFGDFTRCLMFILVRSHFCTDTLVKLEIASL
ncbi:hypothetical protein [Nostoc sp. C052]|uniref:hypothetical protein n=1 Tax=Nostoc sp. C052 TaxID=2576902 RepID=UPI0015C3DA92|nr:hypothetical protein [Nostoc sp. C052]